MKRVALERKEGNREASTLLKDAVRDLKHLLHNILYGTFHTKWTA